MLKRSIVGAIGALFVLGTVASVSWGQSKEPPKAPEIKTQQQPNSTTESQSKTENQTGDTRQIAPVEEYNPSDYAKRQADNEAQKRAEEASEYGVFFGRRLKITDALLTLFTMFLVVVGVGQGIFLYRTDQGTHKAANAAQDSADIAKHTLISTQRAFVFLKKFSAGFIYENGRVHHIVFFPEWENGGTTPAKKLKTWTGFVFTKNTGTIDDIEITEADKVPIAAAVMGPKVTAPGTKIQVPIKDAMSAWRKEVRLFLWAFVEYEDIFETTKGRHTQISVEVVFGENPSGITPANLSDNTLDFKVIGSKYNSAE